MNNSSSNPKPTLPKDYYCDHFEQLLVTVHQRYVDLLNPSELKLINNWTQASPDARRLLVRLFLRKGPIFFADHLQYREIENTEAALQELAKLALIEFDPIAYAHELIQLLPIQNARILFEAPVAKPKKNELLEFWLDDEQLMHCSEWGVHERIITLMHYQELRTLQLLYFGNERQTLTEFVLQDIGVARYEQYPLDAQNRLFSSRADIETYQQINDASEEFYLLSLNRDWEKLPALAHQVLTMNPSKSIDYRWHRLLNRIGYRLEQCQELELALSCFETNDTPPARERRARIWHKQGLFEQTQQLLESIQQQPKSADEAVFYRRFVNKNRSALNLAKIEVSKPTIAQRSLTLPSKQGSVEQQTADTLDDCLWLENQLPLAVVGLACWSVIFANVDGVWHHPFQSHPTDLYDAEFLSRRMAQYEHIFTLNKTDLREQIARHWHEKAGINNVFVNWKNLELNWILRCYDALTLHQWHGIFRHLFSDIKQHRSGFPDLFQCNENHYAFIEVKGPGDKLQNNQQAWLQVFRTLNICAYVCHVDYEH